MIQQNGKYYLYRHIRLDNNEVFYVGVGTKYMDKRKKNATPYRRAFIQSLRSKFWKNIVAKTSFYVEIICESDSYEFIEEKEKEFIALYGRKDLGTGTLCNLTDGGKGQRKVHNRTLTDDHKKKISESRIGAKFSDEHRKKMSQAKKNNPVTPWKGKTFSEEHKQNLRKAKLKQYGKTIL